MLSQGIDHTGLVDAQPVGDSNGDDPAQVAAVREERSRRRLRQTARDMILSMLVVSGVVVVLVLPWNRGNSDSIKVVDPAPVIAAARTSIAWPVLAPQGLPADWRCTSARITSAGDSQPIVHLGYLSPAVRYVGVEESATREKAFVRDETMGGQPAGSLTVGSTTWQRLESPDGKQRSLVNVAGGVTYIVTGQAAWPDIEAFTRSLVGG